MGFYEIANHPLIYILVICGILYVLGFALILFRKSWKRALQLGYSKKQLMDTVKSSVTFSIVPSIAIVVGFFSLAAMIGIPWPWWRLSVIGSVIYEAMAADMALSAANIQLSDATSTEFVLVMFVMTIGILGGLIFSLFIAKGIQKNVLKQPDQDPRWGALGNSVFMLTMMIVFIVPMIVDGGVALLTLATSAVITLLLGIIIKKSGAVWLNNFVLAFSLLGAMASSVLWSAILG